MSAVAGLLTTLNADTTNDLVGEYQETILVRNSKGMNAGATLFGLMSKLKTEPCESSHFKWFERDPVRRELAINTADATAPTALNEEDTIVFKNADGVTAATFLQEGHVLRNARTGEYMRVITTPTTNTVTVARAFHEASLTMTGFTLVEDDVIQVITLAKNEGAAPVRSMYESPELLSNYIQTFNSTVEITNAFKASRLRTDLDGPLKDHRIAALERVSKDIELALLLGTRNRIDPGSGAGNKYFTGGVKDSVDIGAPANVLAGLGDTGVTLEVFTAWLATFMTVGSDAKLAFCGPQAYSVMSNFANAASHGFRIMNQETVFGTNITVINTPYGELSLAFHPLLKEVASLTGWMFVVDLAHIVQKTMEPLFLERNIQLPGTDSYKEQYRAKLGLKLKFADAFGYASNFKKIL